MDLTDSRAIDHGPADVPNGQPRTNARPHLRRVPDAEPKIEVNEVTTWAEQVPTAVSFRPFVVPDQVSAPGAPSERLNRLINIVLAVIALLVLSPVLLLLALAVRLTSRGPILYRQVRVGIDYRYRSRRRHRERRQGVDRRAGLDRRGRVERRARPNRRSPAALPMHGRRWQDIGGRPFRIYKFRSMCVDAECKSGAVWATKGDARVTPLGRVMRQFRLDELPQLINVVKGDMNIVGPRPERPSIFSRLRVEIPDYPLRQRARPGITGWAQVKHTYDTSVDDVRRKVHFDLEYLGSRSILRDLGIMVRTVPTVLFRRGW
ncbi:MAG TPA: sugar transferase [Gemmatimonadaceae bacterium]|nr:sugar transferase [Gemmatimonadaceae bacterium]